MNLNNFKNASSEREKRRKEKKEDRFYSKKKVKLESRIYRLKKTLTSFVLFLEKIMKDAREDSFSNFKKLIDEQKSSDEEK